MTSTALLWYRRDLRLHDHPALVTALHEHERVIPVFVFDDALLHGRFASAPRTSFMLGCLRELDAAWRAHASGLVIRAGRPEHELVRLARELDAGAVFWTSDVAPYARRRDTRVTEALRGAAVQPRPTGGGYCIDVARPRTSAGGPYGVFTPFWRAWQRLERRAVHRAPRALPALPSGVRKGRIPRVDALGISGHDVPEPIVAPGEAAARAAVARWLRGPIDAYADRHDSLSDPGTSTLSPYLRWGCLSALECEQRAQGHGGAGARAWVRQLCWRDFLAHVLLLHPDNAHAEHQARFRGTLAWADDDDGLAAWQEGRTGYPLVDAGMRQLARTGWMHNRVRLVVGSFLTKDLHLDWRLGEAWFERLLLDGEPAQNNGNWQWIASVGVDPAPAFRRLLNPTLQQRKFDPDGSYVRRWVPELGAVDDRRLAEPWTMSEAEQHAAGCVIGRDYPPPIVEHAHERERALARYRAAGR